MMSGGATQPIRLLLPAPPNERTWDVLHTLKYFIQYSFGQFPDNHCQSLQLPPESVKGIQSGHRHYTQQSDTKIINHKLEQYHCIIPFFDFL